MWHWDWTSITCLVKDLNVNYPSSPNRRRPQINLKIFNPLDKTAIEPSTENFLGHNVENIKALGCFTPEFNWYFRLCDKKITLQNALDKCFSPWKRIVDLLLFWWISKLELNFASAINRLLSSRPCGNILFYQPQEKLKSDSGVVYFLFCGLIDISWNPVMLPSFAPQRLNVLKTSWKAFFTIPLLF